MQYPLPKLALKSCVVFVAGHDEHVGVFVVHLQKRVGGKCDYVRCMQGVEPFIFLKNPLRSMKKMRMKSSTVCKLAASNKKRIKAQVVQEWSRDKHSRDNRGSGRLRSSVFHIPSDARIKTPSKPNGRENTAAEQLTPEEPTPLKHASRHTRLLHALFVLETSAKGANRP